MGLVAETRLSVPVVRSTSPKIQCGPLNPWRTGVGVAVGSPGGVLLYVCVLSPGGQRRHLADLVVGVNLTYLPLNTLLVLPVTV